MSINYMFRFIVMMAAFALLPPAILAQTKSAKRGMCWDEKTQSLTYEPVEKMLPGVSWIYNWGVCPARNVSDLGKEGGIDFVPMCWSVEFNEKRLRVYIEEHPGVKYLLGFNEPNFLYQSNLTPKMAASKL